MPVAAHQKTISDHKPLACDMIIWQNIGRIREDPFEEYFYP
jgi:hypothetical protein